MQKQYQMDIGQKPMENPVAIKMCVLARCELHKRRARGIRQKNLQNLDSVQLIATNGEFFRIRTLCKAIRLSFNVITNVHLSHIARVDPILAITKGVSLI
jgi:hypothetical protein